MGRLPAWCEPLPDAATMREVDRWASEQRGVPSLELMERAGAGVAQAVEELAPDGPVLVVCGKGNNGGDGLVAARLLRHAGRAVSVLCSAPLAELTGDARTNLERLPGERPVELRADGIAAALASEHASALEHAGVVIDALLGTGFEGSPRGVVGETIALLNRASIPVVSVDVPSGVDASTGVVRGEAVAAALTVTFHAAKPGLWIHPGKAHAGEVRVLDIGIPRGAPDAAGVGLIGTAILERLPRRASGSTKFDSGHVVLVGGSRGLSGAPRMAAHAAMRAGAGYVTACVPASLQDVVAADLPELMTSGLPEQEGQLTPAGVQAVLDMTKQHGALALGPGLGRSESTVKFARDVAREAKVALVLDADGLNAHAGRLAELAGREAPTVLTPHAGELGRLLERSSAEIQRERLQHVRAAAEQAQAVVVLKGDDTLVADPEGTVAVSAGASPALATAGTGDVLTGVIAALLAQGLDAFTAACAGVLIHARAGRAAARTVGAAEGVIASDVIAALPAARAAHAARLGELG